MKPGFALSLSEDGISLLHRAAGGWRLVGDVGLETDDLATALADLRAQAKPLHPGALSCKLIIPNSQIRYLTLDTGVVDTTARMHMAREALEGATPYAVEDLAFDLSQDGAQTHIAAVAVETLHEAEAFATEHGFGPTSFVAAPGEMAFLGEPFFGTARAVRGVEVEPDGIAVVNIGPAQIPAPKEMPPAAPKTATPQPATEPDKPEVPSTINAVETSSAAKSTSAPAPESPSQQADVADSPAAIPVAGFSSRRGKTETAAPALQGAARTTPPPAPPRTKPVAAPVAPPASVIAATVPGLDDNTRPTAASTSFVSRRHDAAPIAATKVKGKVQKPAVAAKKPDPNALSSNPFMAREALEVGGKPRYLGLALVTLLLVIMAVVAAWAVYSNGSLFRFGQGPAPQPPADTVPLTAPEGPPASLESSGPTDPVVEIDPQPIPELIAPQVSALPEALSVLAPEAQPQIDSPAGLSGTDTAVLDVLRQPIQTDLDPEAIADGIQPPSERSLPELSQAAQYAATGIWQHVPEIPKSARVISLTTLYVASIDNTDLSQDAVALPLAASLATDRALDLVSSPANADSAFDLDARGLVRATPEGTLNPDGIMIYLGRPKIVPPPSPLRQSVPAEPELVYSGKRPRTRPTDLVEQAERARLGGLSRAELGQARPRSRPASLKPANEDELPSTEYAIALSKLPKARPINFANLVDRAQRNTSRSNPAAAASLASLDRVTPASPITPVTPVEPATVTPSIPTSASVARQATLENSINLRKVNLIGVYGSPSNRRALVRLASGRYKKVKVGDRLDGGKVVAIGDAELRYQKGSRNLTLKIPSG